MTTMKLKITILALIISTAVFGQQKIEKEFTGVKKITMTTSTGDCILKKGDTDKVSITVEYTFDKDDYAPEFEQNGETLRIKEKFNNRSNNGNSKWTLTVPNDMDIKFNTGSGDFEAKDLKVELSLNTGSGDYYFERMSGEIVSNSGSGDLKLTDFEGDIKANTGSGDVNVTGTKGELKINTGSGDIAITDASGGIFANVGSGNIYGTNITVSESSGFNSGSGDVKVVLATSPKADIALNSGSGDAKLDFSGNEIEGLITMKADKKNGTIKAPFDFDSTEEIRENGNQTVIKKTAKIGNGNVKINIGTGSGTASIQK
jgi:hypothetical protein